MSQGWLTRPLGEICERVTVGHVGVTAPYYRDEGVLFLRTQNVGRSGLDLDDARYITPEFHASLVKSEVKGGDILMSRVITHTVNCALIPNDLGPANCANVVLVRPGQAIVPEFLAHYIRSPAAQKYLMDRKVGSAQLVVNTTVVKEWPVPVPPLPEQQRIVALLDEAFAGLATAKANAERNLRNAHTIFESHLESVFSQRGEGWEETELCNVCTLLNGRAYRKDEMLDSGKYPLLRVGNFFSNRDWYYSDLELDPDKYCDSGDLLYAWSASFGPRVWEGNKVIYHYHIWKVIPNEAVVSKRLLLYLLQWDVEQIKAAHGTGTTMMHVSKGSMESRVVPVPPLGLQSEIVSRLDSLGEHTQRLTHIYESKLTALEELKKSLLQKAFNGDL